MMLFYGKTLLFQEGLLLVLLLVLRTIHDCMRRRSFAAFRGCRPEQSNVPMDPIGLDFVYERLFGKPSETYVEDTHQAFRRLGATYAARRWTWDTIYTCDSRNIQYVLATGFDDFALPQLRVSAMASLLGRGIFTMDGPSWAHARGVFRPSFSKRNMEPLVGILEKHFQAMLRHVGSQTDLQPLFFRLTMDIATEFLMGHSTGMLAGLDEPAEQFVDDYMLCSTEIVRRMQAGPLQHFMVNRAAARAKRCVFRFIDTFIDESMQSPSTGYDVLRELAGDRKALRDQVLHILLASRDTTASLLSNLFFVLAQRPRIYRRLRQEVFEVAGREPPTASQLKEMKYLRWCVNECKRLLNFSLSQMNLTI